LRSATLEVPERRDVGRGGGDRYDEARDRYGKTSYLYDELS
jgi:hypothetical protein